jgi:hypothetical protein
VERGAIKEVGKFPFEVLSEDKGKAGVVRLERRAGGYAGAKPESETGLPERATESSVTTRTWSARELIEKIIESENKIRSWEVRATYMPPDPNGFKEVYDMGYDQGKKYEQGTRFDPPGESVILNAPPGAEPVYGPACTSEFKRVFDGTKCYKLEDDISFSVREGKASVKYKGKRGEIHRGMGYNWGPQMLLGYWVNGLLGECGGDTLGEVLLRLIKKVRIRKAPEEIDGHLCVVVEVLGVRDYVPEGIYGADDLHIWIDTERDFRPLRIETYRFKEQYKGRRLTGMRKELVRTFETTKLKRIEGIWFPTAGECKGYTVKIDESSIRLNERIDPEKFAPIEFGPGCRVSDTFSNAFYTVGGFDDPSYEPETPLEELLKKLVYREVEVDPELTQELLIGQPAVTDLIAELRRTDKKEVTAHSALAFTLRAIGDPSAVPALIDALDGCQAMSEFGLGKDKRNLLRFMKRNQADPSERGVHFSAPGWEITASLEKLTGHSEGYRHLCRVDLRGRPIPCRVFLPESQMLPEESSRAVARRWRRWWQMNKDRFLEPGLRPRARHGRYNGRRRARW